MIEITYVRGQLSVISLTDDPIMRGAHRPYFETVLSMRVRPAGDGYEAIGLQRPAERIEDILEHLTENALAHHLDEEAQRLVERARGAGVALATALAAGAEVLAADVGEVRPPGFTRTLLDHQWRPVQHLLTVGNGANFSVPGAGKTSVVLGVFSELRAREDVEILLVVGPGSCFMAWEDEFQNCFGREPRVVRLSGNPDARRLAYQAATRADLVLVTYQTAVNDVADLIGLLRNKNTLLVLDESHYVKGSGPFAETVLALAPEATRRIILTGTPMPNNHSDLWTQITFLWPNQILLGNRTQFRTQIATAAGRADVQRRIRPLFTRVRKSDLNLPPEHFRPVMVEMGDVQRRVYDALAASTLQNLNLAPTERLALRQWRKAKTVRLLQAACNPGLIAQGAMEFEIPPDPHADEPVTTLIEHYGRYEMPPKILAAVAQAKLLLERDEDTKVVVWTHFIQNLELLVDLLAEFGALPLYGGVPRDEADDEDYNRERHIRLFKTDTAVRVLVANPGAVAEAISLHRVCRHAIYVDRSFNAGQFIQSRNRIHRVGLLPHEDVTYHLLLTEGSIDEVVNRRLADKEATMNQLLDDDDAPVVSMPVSTGDLFGTEDELDFAAVIEQLRARRDGAR
jgi:SNF2 family DNA or RNA helicase